MFPGMRRDDGSLRFTSEAEYLATRYAYMDALDEYGIGNEWLASRITELMEHEVSPSEFRWRLNAMDERIMAQAEELRIIYSTYYGLDGMSDEALLAAAIDPHVRQGLLERQITIAEIGGEALQSGYDIGLGLSTRLFQEQVDRGRADELFETAADVLPGLGRASGRQQEGELGLEQFLGVEVFGDPLARQQLRRTLQGETSDFSQQSVFDRSQVNALSGLRPR
jgi:hypothetical protein